MASLFGARELRSRAKLGEHGVQAPTTRWVTRRTRSGRPTAGNAKATAEPDRKEAQQSGGPEGPPLCVNSGDLGYGTAGKPVALQFTVAVVDGAPAEVGQVMAAALAP